jgi:hypothetical protein
MNQREWYISKKLRASKTLIAVSPYSFRYCSKGAFCGMMVPIMDAAARPMSRKMVSLNEQKKFHREFTKPLLVDFKKILLKERMVIHGKSTFHSTSKKAFSPLRHLIYWVNTAGQD